jgi:mannose-6-phosphate isomerase-like protein (cupin superfamily)
MQLHRLSAVRKEGKAYVEFFRTRDLSLGVYRLPAGASDSQQPHAEEEVYHVISGRARFRAVERDVDVKAGDILFVPAGEPHHFHDIQEDLELLAFFAPLGRRAHSAKNAARAKTRVSRALVPGDTLDLDCRLLSFDARAAAGNLDSLFRMAGDRTGHLLAVWDATQRVCAGLTSS